MTKRKPIIKNKLKPEEFPTELTTALDSFQSAPIGVDEDFQDDEIASDVAGDIPETTPEPTEYPEETSFVPSPIPLPEKQQETEIPPVPIITDSIPTNDAILFEGFTGNQIEFRVYEDAFMSKVKRVPFAYITYKNPNGEWTKVKAVTTCEEWFKSNGNCLYAATLDKAKQGAVNNVPDKILRLLTSYTKSV